MRLLNDRQLSDLLRRAKANPPKPAPGFAARVMQAYQTQSGRQSVWQRVVSGTIRIPIPAVIFASIAMVLLGMVLGRRLGEKPLIGLPAVQEQMATNVVRQDRPVLSLYGLQPVPELRPRIFRRAHEKE